MLRSSDLIVPDPAQPGAGNFPSPANLRRVLLIAFHFPPAQGFSGTQRSLAMVRHLPEFGWSPLVLSAHPRAYPRVGDEQLSEIPPTIPIHRAWALDAVRHMAIRGHYWRLTALPDRWSSWWPDGVRAGLSLIRRHRPRVIWSTYPIATAHLIAWSLHRLTGLPWVADFRDPMVTEGFPQDATLHQLYERLERRFMRSCHLAVTTTPGMRDLLLERYPEAQGRIEVIRNGYPEGILTQPTGPAPSTGDGPVVLVHSGACYLGDDERNPRPLLAALAALRQRGVIRAPSDRQDRAIPVRLILRASTEDASLGLMLAALELGGLVELAPLLSYPAAMAEMVAAHGLVLLQGRRFNRMVPTKLYEYLRVGQPILALTEPTGESATLLQEAGADALILPLRDQAGIEAFLPGFLRRLQLGKKANPPLPQAMTRYGRRAGAEMLAGILDRLE